jgi:hypothetical protein
MNKSCGAGGNVFVVTDWIAEVFRAHGYDYLLLITTPDFVVQLVKPGTSV